MLVEGGAQLAASLLRADLVDRIAWFHAPAVMGGDGWPAVQAFGVERLDAMPRFSRVAETPLGDDMLTEFDEEVLNVHRHRHRARHGPRHRAPRRQRRHAPDDHHAWPDTASIPIGASIGCSGCCLTAVEVGADWFAAEASAETLAQTTLGALAGGHAGQPGTLAASRR